MMVAYWSMHHTGHVALRGKCPAPPPEGCGDQNLCVPGSIFPAPPPKGRGDENLWLPPRIFPALPPVGCDDQDLWVPGSIFPAPPPVGGGNQNPWAPQGQRANAATSLGKTHKTQQNPLSTAIQSVKFDSAAEDDFKGLLSRGERVLFDFSNTHFFA